jgi:repressor LexA
MQALTKKQKEIFDYISGFIDEQGYSPSYREIAKNFELSSVATVAEHINTLKSKGYLEIESGIARSVQISDEVQEEISTIPLLGYIAAGFPIEAIRTSETLDIPRDMSGPNVFALKVRGDSMIDDGILDGDYVIIERCHNPRNGDIVVALLDKDNVTLKRFYKERNFVRLQPANKKYTAIKAKKVEVQGKLKGVIRKFR